MKSKEEIEALQERAASLSIQLIETQDQLTNAIEVHVPSINSI